MCAITNLPLNLLSVWINKLIASLSSSFVYEHYMFEKTKAKSKCIAVKFLLDISRFLFQMFLIASNCNKENHDFSYIEWEENERACQISANLCIKFITEIYFTYAYHTIWSNFKLSTAKYAEIHIPFETLLHLCFQ